MAFQRADGTNDGSYATLNHHFYSSASVPLVPPTTQMPAYTGPAFVNTFPPSEHLAYQNNSPLHRPLQESSQYTATQQTPDPRLLHRSQFNIGAINFFVPPSYPLPAPNNRPSNNFELAPPIFSNNPTQHYSTTSYPTIVERSAVHDVDRAQVPAKRNDSTSKPKRNRRKANNAEQQITPEIAAIRRSIEHGLIKNGHPVVDGKVSLLKPKPNSATEARSQAIATPSTQPQQRVHIFKGSFYNQIVSCYGGQLPAGSRIGKHDRLGMLVVIPMVDGDNALEPLLSQIRQKKAARAAMSAQPQQFQGRFAEPSGYPSTSTMVPPLPPNDELSDYFTTYINEDAYE